MAHEAQPHKSDQHQLVEKESRDHSTPPPSYRWRNEGILLGFQTVGISRKLEVHGRVEDPRFTSVRDSGKAWQVIEERLTAWFTARPVKEAIDTFSRHGIPINAVNDIPTAAHESQLHDRELLVEVPDPIAGRIHVSGKNLKLSRSEVVVGSASLPGQHTADLLTSLLHYTPEEVKKLESEGAVYCSAAL